MASFCYFAKADWNYWFKACLSLWWLGTEVSIAMPQCKLGWDCRFLLVTAAINFRAYPASPLTKPTFSQVKGEFVLAIQTGVKLGAI